MTAERLKKAIDKRGLKQKFVAEKAGISEQTLSAMLNGKQGIDVDTFFAIAEVIKMTPGEIMEFQAGA